MERRSVSEHKEHFQTILRNVENDTKLEVFDAEETAGSKVGDNYLSVVLKTVVNGKRGNGEPYSGIFMTKYLPHHRVFAAAMRNDEVFLNEAHVYNKILPYLGDIGPKCIFADKNEIIMEDLKSQGYIIKPRLDLLDLQHCTALVEKLATLHARSLNLKFKDNKLFNELLSPLSEAVFPLDDKPSMGTSLEISLTTAIKHLESLEQSDAINNGINLLKKFENKTFSIMSNLVKQGQNKYDVITHGDSWINNLLFKNNKNGCIEDVKLTFILIN
ncbi:hypothetical protein HCN44_008231 [Aphidius gifuensis]|uniref:CHK kinase-like domain-containing protein n=1 Tax=Aphidius gifuensis TaxID=684658 RepID=A0A834XQ20_APHGI|nr:hypothetical protein HCN44_008231 [Aphidius gifuensis]